MSHIEKSPLDRCPYCGSVNLDTVPCRTGPHFARVRCLDCKRQLRWAPAPLSPEHARAFVMPFGKYKGMTLGAIVATPDGSRYLRWLLSEADLRPGLARKLRMALGGIAAEAPGRSG